MSSFGIARQGKKIEEDLASPIQDRLHCFSILCRLKPSFGGTKMVKFFNSNNNNFNIYVFLTKKIWWLTQYLCDYSLCALSFKFFLMLIQ
jgi:hypothetical protein